jgi:hypothetical protein
MLILYLRVQKLDTCPAGPAACVDQSITKSSWGSQSQPIDIDSELHAGIIDQRSQEKTQNKYQHVAQHGDNMCSKCPGFFAKLPDGKSPYGSYPWVIHQIAAWQWTPEVREHRLFLQATSCHKTTFYVLCVSCVKIGQLPVVKKIIEHVKNGAKESTPWFWLSLRQLHECDQRIQHQLNASKLHMLNL